MKSVKERNSPRTLLFIWGIGEIILAVLVPLIWQNDTGIFYWIKGIIFSILFLSGLWCIKDGIFASDSDILKKMAHKANGIGFDSDLIPLILNGSKTLTYRLGDKYASLNVGDKISIRDSSSGKTFAVVEVTEKSTVSFGALPIDRQGHEAYPSKDAQRQIFKQYYGREIKDDEPMLVLGFKLIIAGRDS